MKTKFLIIISLLCFLLAGTQNVSSQSVVPFERASEYSASPPPATQAPRSDGSFTNGPDRATTAVYYCPLCGAILYGGKGSPCVCQSTTGGAAVSEGCWLLAGLAMIYGVACRKRKEGKWMKAKGEGLMAKG